MSKPEMMAVPLVGEMSPVNMLNVVVFPAPVCECVCVCVCVCVSE